MIGLMVRPAPQRMSLATFLQWDDGTDTRYELHDGVPVAMAPPAPRHSVLATNLAALFHRQLSPPCRAYSEAGIILGHERDAYYQADLAVSCTPIAPDSKAIPEPALVVEILSPSTANSDLLEKVPNYRDVPSIETILLVSSVQQRVEVQQRADHSWTLETWRSADDAIHLEALGVQLRVGDLYEGVPF